MSYVKTVDISAPLGRVWKAWSSKAETERWLAPRANVVFEEGGTYEFFWDEDPNRDSTLGCKLVAIDPTRMLRFQWQGKTEFLPMFQAPHGVTEIKVRFSEADGRTRVTVEQAETRDLPDWEAYDEWMASAWEHALAQLKDYCEGLSAAEKDPSCC